MGSPITQLLPIDRTSTITAVLPVSRFDVDNTDLVLLTRQGLIKRTPLSQFSKINSRGLGAMRLRDGDSLQFVGTCAPDDSILLTSSSGMAIHFTADKLRPMARSGMGTKTMGESDASTSMPAGAAKAGAPAKAKAPPTSYFLFASDVRPIVQAEVAAANGGKASIGTMGKAIGARWTALSDAEKQIYKERADAMKAAASASAAPAAEAEDAADEGEDESAASSSDGGDFVVGMSVLPTGLAIEADDSFDEDDASMESASGPWLLILSKKGYGKRVPVSSFRLQGRLGKGLKAARLPAGDSLAAAVIVGTLRSESCDDDVLISTTNGMLLRVAINDISSMSRSARGSRIVKLKGGDEVGTVTIINK